MAAIYDVFEPATAVVAGERVQVFGALRKRVSTRAEANRVAGADGIVVHVGGVDGPEPLPQPGHRGVERITSTGRGGRTLRIELSAAERGWTHVAVEWFDVRADKWRTSVGKTDGTREQAIEYAIRLAG